METTLSLADIRSQHVRIHAHEVVAIGQSLIRDRFDPGEAHPPYGPLALETVAIDSTGAVHLRCTAATPSVAEVAILLQSLLDDREVRVPGGLRYTIGRALHEVEAPPFDSLDEFAKALERFGQGAPAQVLTGLVNRVFEIAPAVRVPHTGVDPVDRRQTGPSASCLRRELRQADLRLYEAQPLGCQPRRLRTPTPKRRRRAPLAACMVAGVAVLAVGAFGHPGIISGWTAAGRTATVDTVDAGTAAGVQPVGTVFRMPATAARDTGAATSAMTTVARGTVPRIVRVTAMGAQPVARSTRSMRAVPAVSSRKVRTGRRQDKGVVARIRFEWGNPFR